MADLEITVDGDFGSVLDDKRKAMARAAMESAAQVAELIKKGAAADIAAAGFSSRWQTSLSATVYPKSTTAIDPAVFVADRIPYSGVFENGASISGKPLLWLPLPSAADFIGRGKRASPAAFQARGLDLISIRGSGKPLLGVRQAFAGKLRLTPVFIGVPAVQIQQKFHIRQVVQHAADQWAGLYAAAFKDEA